MLVDLVVTLAGIVNRYIIKRSNVCVLLNSSKDVDNSEVKCLEMILLYKRSSYGKKCRLDLLGIDSNYLKIRDLEIKLILVTSYLETSCVLHINIGVYVRD